jgi:hypothetical protein
MRVVIRYHRQSREDLSGPESSQQKEAASMRLFCITINSHYIPVHPSRAARHTGASPPTKKAKDMITPSQSRCVSTAEMHEERVTEK